MCDDDEPPQVSPRLTRSAAAPYFAFTTSRTPPAAGAASTERGRPGEPIMTGAGSQQPVAASIGAVEVPAQRPLAASAGAEMALQQLAAASTGTAVVPQLFTVSVGAGAAPQHAPADAAAVSASDG